MIETGFDFIGSSSSRECEDLFGVVVGSALFAVVVGSALYGVIIPKRPTLKNGQSEMS